MSVVAMATHAPRLSSVREQRAFASGDGPRNGRYWPSRCCWSPRRGHALQGGRRSLHPVPYRHGDGATGLDLPRPGRLLGDVRPLLMATDPPYGLEYDPSGRDCPPQSHCGVYRIANWSPSVTTTITTEGLPITPVGTVSHVMLAATNITASMRRWRLTSAVALATTLTLAMAINCIGIGFQRGIHTRRQLVANDGTGAPTLTDMGARFAVATGGVLTPFIAAPPNGSSVWMRVVVEVSGAVFEQEISADLPASTHSLSPRLIMNNRATVAGLAYDCWEAM